ncbi:MAG: hypothetical protein CMN85_10955 [Spongiibacteraceae bacterium]|uniref:virulence-associated E family protein n=1 Tax=uncultured Haliea sp. TaxID=622616 RepID=UPI000C3B78A2|nr:hypothetical protein [Spongiibacteraceae bacterium]|tara:strand:+ start:11000 stop:12409 length:1410 start_codon:yes stop_codon:yes gene_type:complete
MSDALTDFNDLHCAHGLDTVRDQVERAYHNFVETRSVESAPPEPEQEELPSPPDLDWLRQMQKTRQGAFMANIYNAHMVLSHDSDWQGVLGYCEFSYRIIKRRVPPWFGGVVGEWTDADTARLRIWISKKYGFSPKSADAEDAILVAAQDKSFHPVTEYLDGLVWDRQPRVRSWLKTYMGAESSAEDAGERARYERYVSLVGTMWLIAAIARVVRPPVKSDCVLILEGLQGLGKSTALEILGGSWFSDTHFALGEKDGYQQMQGVWICELAELDSFNKAESTRAKQFFASSEDRYRPAYGRRAHAFARQCVFAGTTNQDSYLKDPTGNRRYWPVFCYRLDAVALARDRDQLWAEAYQLYCLGEKWWVQEHDKHLFEEQQEARFASDVWEDLIVEYLRDPMNNAEVYFTTNDLMAGALRLEPAQMRQPEQTRVGQIMTRLGWRKSRRAVLESSGKQVRKWVYERPPDWKG